jgi:hypothetical protein
LLTVVQIISEYGLARLSSINTDGARNASEGASQRDNDPNDVATSWAGAPTWP